MLIDDIMEHVRRSHPEIEKALLDARCEAASELGRFDLTSVRLSISEVSRSVRPFMADFFHVYPTHAKADAATRNAIIRKLDKLNVCMFLLQFPERIQDVIQEFRFENRLASEASAELAFVYGPLLRTLDRAATSPAALKEALPSLKGMAADTLGRLPEGADPQAQRALLEIIEYMVHAFPNAANERTSDRQQDIDTVHEHPANDNRVSSPLRMR